MKDSYETNETVPWVISDLTDSCGIYIITGLIIIIYIIYNNIIIYINSGKTDA